VITLRPWSVLKDDAIPTLLLKATQPTFVTINVTDFWKKVQPHTAYCVTTVALPIERIQEVPPLLRRLLKLPDFKTKALRMGKVVRLTPGHIEYYSFDGQVQSISWLD